MGKARARGRLGGRVFRGADQRIRRNAAVDPNLARAGPAAAGRAAFQLRSCSTVSICISKLKKRARPWALAA
ncbi:hypothetical protein ACAN107058_18320 [Paracidovorax anthurii]|uniref:Uncharacterized protein n=1 Tax=Paracidovorax anthurii TaxID=78229 RepID=A0A328ZAY3_9BURK|nr:hypothetical protein AX018_101936 [Paracidovorax anthurii]